MFTVVYNLVLHLLKCYQEILNMLPAKEASIKDVPYKKDIFTAPHILFSQTPPPPKNI